MILEPDLLELIPWAAIAPVSALPNRKDKAEWRNNSQTVSYGLFNDIPLVVLPHEDIRTAYQSLSGVLPKTHYHYKVASDITTYFTELSPCYETDIFDKDLQRAEIIRVLIFGWQKSGNLPDSPKIHAGNIQDWLYQVSVRSDPIGYHRNLPKDESKHWLVKRFIVSAQSCNLLPKCAWIRHDNAQEWLHLFVPIHDPWISIPPGTRDLRYWSWHNKVARKYWQRCRITDEECLRFNRLWDVYRPNCTPYLSLDKANIVNPQNKPDKMHFSYFEMVYSGRREGWQNQSATQTQSETPVVGDGSPAVGGISSVVGDGSPAVGEGGPVVGDGGMVTSGDLTNHPLNWSLDQDSEDRDYVMEDVEGDSEGGGSSTAEKSSVQRFQEAAYNLHQNTPATLSGHSPSFQSSQAGNSDQEEDEDNRTTPSAEMHHHNNAYPNQGQGRGGRGGRGGGRGGGGRRSTANSAESQLNLRESGIPNAGHALPPRPLRPTMRPKIFVRTPPQYRAGNYNPAAVQQYQQHHTYNQYPTQQPGHNPWTNPNVPSFNAGSGFDLRRRRQSTTGNHGTILPSEARRRATQENNYGFTNLGFQPMNSASPSNASPSGGNHLPALHDRNATQNFGQKRSVTSSFVSPRNTGIAGNTGGMVGQSQQPNVDFDRGFNTASSVFNDTVNSSFGSASSRPPSTLNRREGPDLAMQNNMGLRNNEPRTFESLHAPPSPEPESRRPTSQMVTNPQTGQASVVAPASPILGSFFPRNLRVVRRQRGLESKLKRLAPRV
ncbi:hypothetical protein PG984_011360 [Apiospora sp. TS-2023a]